MIGDLRSAALVSKQGSIDWMCLPRFDSPWLFGRLLDWDRGGFLQLIPVHAGASIFRQYRRDSNVLQTIWTLEHSRMRVVDFMPVALRGKKLRPPESLRLVRMLQPLAGRTEWKLTFKPRFDYGRELPSLRELRPGMVVADGEDASIFLQYPVASPRSVPAAISIDDAHALLHQTDDYWVDWLRSTTYRGRFDEPLHRSALALKLMQYLPSGAFVAAPTSSLPESPGGSLNWDYRYSWVRDTADLVNALGEMGFGDEADG
ncbi:MAG: glycoside hydrolase family 15 protein, partial [Chloroflexi bacterium]